MGKYDDFRRNNENKDGQDVNNDFEKTAAYTHVTQEQINEDYASRMKNDEHASVFVERKKPANMVLSILANIMIFIVVGIVIVIAVFFGAGNGLADAYLESTPELDITKIEDQAQTSYIYDQEGNLLATYTGSENREWASLEDIPEKLQNAVIAIEDIRFRQHNGVDYKRLMGALVSNVTSDKVEGGSTLTQQLIKNNLLSSERSYKRKLQEAYLAVQLEDKYSKDEILEYYLNNMPLGGTIYGVKAAAKDYFGKELDELSLKQIACLASITQSPYAMNPRRVTYVTQDVGKLQNRMNLVLQRMYNAGYITKEEYDANFVPRTTWESDGYLETWKAEMGILEESPSNSMYAMPHFTEYVIYDVCTHLLRKYDLEDNVENRAKMEQEIREGGYSIYATVDADIQDTVQSTLSTWDDYPPLENGETEIINSDGSSTIQPQASSTVIDYHTGYIVALIGSRDAPSSKKTLNRAYQAGMPVGSSIKPITVYGAAFDNGCGLVTPVANVPVPVTGWQTEKGYPTTSQGTYGPVSMHEAIVQSLNICAARTLMDYVGLETSASYLINQGIDPDKINVDGVGLALGSSGLTTLDMATCYSTLANDGFYQEPVSFTKVVDSKGDIVLDSQQTRKVGQIYKESSAWMVIQALIDAVDHGTGTRAKLDGFETAGKTGTVTDARGTFFAGMTGYYVSTLWVGADDFSPLDASAASRVTAPLWKEYMTLIHAGLEDKPIRTKTAEEVGLVETTVCAYSGMLPGDGCSDTITDLIAAEDVPKEHCTWCVSTKICTVSNMLAGEYCPAETVVDYSARVFPENSPWALWELSNAIPQVDEAGNPIEPMVVDTVNVCTVHTAERNDSVNYASNAITMANNAISQYGQYMTADQLNTINTGISNLITLINGNTPAADLRTAADNLVTTVNNIVSSIVIPPQPQPEPEPEPEPTP